MFSTKIFSLLRITLLFGLLAIGGLYYNYSSNSLPSNSHNLSIVEKETLTVHKSEFIEVNNRADRHAFLEIKDLPLKDHKVLDYLRKHVLEPPSASPYAFTKEEQSWYKEQVKIIFGNKTDGFFIECGAHDGELLSNSLDLEMKGWEGLLVEAQPELGKLVRTKNRKAWFANVCLSPYKNISEIDFAVIRNVDERWKTALGKLVMDDDREMEDFRANGPVPCFPLVSLMAALNVTHVDYLSLDVEGVEMKILKTLPFDETLVIDYIQVEINHVLEGEKGITEYLGKKGYNLLFKHKIDAFYKRRL